MVFYSYCLEEVKTCSSEDYFCMKILSNDQVSIGYEFFFDLLWDAVSSLALSTVFCQLGITDLTIAYRYAFFLPLLLLGI